MARVRPQRHIEGEGGKLHYLNSSPYYGDEISQASDIHTKFVLKA